MTLTFVTALCALIRPLQVQTEIKERESSWMILSTVVILILGMDGNISRLDGAMLMILYVPYIVSVIRQAKRESAESKQTEAIEKDKKIALHILVVLAAIGGIILGAKITLMGGESLGARLGISPLAMGILIFALGTSLPELAIALSATFKNKGDISIGEIYASNIFTALFVLGPARSFHRWRYPTTSSDSTSRSLFSRESSSRFSFTPGTSFAASRPSSCSRCTPTSSWDTSCRSPSCTVDERRDPQLASKQDALRNG